ncbi:hypothetical protein AB1Y20_001953 [Prymnesium parvum]|uniref:Cytidyltransferase-like domain-containing protein n=1 Tax=Prymnesium parvum TaxID=97485 RepID=A0AB34J7P8_PRYPA
MSSEAAAARLSPAPTALPSQAYALLISGTFNPPHRAHLQLGLRAAAALEAEGHTVLSLWFVPVHDNYLHNKLSASAGPSVVFPIEARCALLRTLLEAEEPAAAARCHVADYEGEHASALLAPSPHYWAARLPAAYLRTVPTMALLHHFAADEARLGGARVAAVFGIDNLAAMSTWNAPERLLARADLLFVARRMATVAFARDPAALLRAIRRVEVRTAVPVVFGEELLFGGEVGSFVAPSDGEAEAGGVLFCLPALEGEDEGLSSTAMRGCLETLWRWGCESAEAVARIAEAQAGTPAEEEVNQSLSVLRKHGYSGGSLTALLRAGMNTAATLERIYNAAVSRGEVVVPHPS